MLAVLLSAVAPPEGLRELLSGAGFPISDHVLGAVPPQDFGEIGVALIDVGDRQDAAIAQTSRWRAELGDDLVPIVWVLSDFDGRMAARGLDAGACAVLSRPLDPTLLLAQVRSALRTRGCASRLAARAAESRLLGEHLKKAHAEADRDAAALRRVRLAFLERSFPAYGPMRIFVSHRPRGQAGGDFYDVARVEDGRIALVVGDAIGPGAASGLLGHLAARIAARRLALSAQPPGAVLVEINRELLGIGLDDLPLLAMLIAIIDPASGEVEIARAGLPPPVHLAADGAGKRWPIPGPFLGTGETAYATHSALLKPGDRLLIGTDGIRPDGNPEPASSDQLLECGERHRDLKGQAFTDAVASKLLSDVRHEEDFTLLVLETEG
jgi:serine phosphatase RsbU (regulator of sigma subunit)